MSSNLHCTPLITVIVLSVSNPTLCFHDRESYNIPALIILNFYIRPKQVLCLKLLLYENFLSVKNFPSSKRLDIIHGVLRRSFLSDAFSHYFAHVNYIIRLRGGKNAKSKFLAK